MYDFVRVKKSVGDERDGQWWFKPSSNGDIYEHFERYVMPYINDGLKEYTTKMFSGDSGEYDNTFARALYVTHQVSGKPLFEVFTYLKLDIFKSRTHSFEEGRTILLDKSPSVLLLNDLYVIDEVVEKDKLVYPDEEGLTIDDVRYIQWYEGMHWYAKIGSFDVVDQFNNQKWNSKEEAKEAAVWFVKNYNR